MEEEVGVALFIRDNRSVELTREGESFIDYATATLANWQRFKTNVKDPQQHIYGKVSIYCSVTASYSFLHQILSSAVQVIYMNIATKSTFTTAQYLKNL